MEYKGNRSLSRIYNSNRLEQSISKTDSIKHLNKGSNEQSIEYELI